MIQFITLFSPKCKDISSAMCDSLNSAFAEVQASLRVIFYNHSGAFSRRKPELCAKRRHDFDVIRTDSNSYAVKRLGQSLAIIDRFSHQTYRTNFELPPNIVRSNLKYSKKRHIKRHVIQGGLSGIAQLVFYSGVQNHDFYHYELISRNAQKNTAYFTSSKCCISVQKVDVAMKADSYDSYQRTYATLDVLTHAAGSLCDALAYNQSINTFTGFKSESKRFEHCFFMALNHTNKKINNILIDILHSGDNVAIQLCCCKWVDGLVELQKLLQWFKCNKY